MAVRKACIRSLMHRRRKSLHRVLDNLPAHKMRAVRDCIDSRRGQLTLHSLPGYAPSPDERVWSQAKRTGSAHQLLRAGKKPADRTRQPTRIRSFFQHPTVAYITD